MHFSSISKPIALWSVFALGLILSTCFSHSLYAQSQPTRLVLYDNFNQKLLDPSKWAPFGACFTWSGLECVREIQTHNLRLAVRSFGATNSNNGIGYGPSELHFANPSEIRRIAATLTVRQTTVANCSANTGTQAVQPLISGTFFNSGSGGHPNDDVQAFLDIEHSSTDPQGQLQAIGFLHWQGQFFGGVFLGTLSVGQAVIAELDWDQPNHQFVVSWTDVDTGQTSSGLMSYTMPDMTLPATPDKFLGVRTFAPNCVGTQMMSAYGETRFRSVWIGR